MGIPISQLPTASHVARTDIIPIVQDGVTSSVTFQVMSNSTNLLPLGSYAVGTDLIGVVQGDHVARQVTVNALGSAIITSLPLVIQPGAGAVARPVQTELRDTLKLDQFGTFAQAVTEAETFAQGRSVNIPPSSSARAVSATVTLAAAKKNTIRGDGRRHTKLQWTGGNSSPIIKQAGPTATADVVIENLELGRSAAQTAVVGIQLGDTAGGNTLLMVDITDVLFNDIATGVAAYDECDELNVDRCWFFDCTSTALLLATPGVTSVSNITLTRSHFQGCDATCIDWQEGSRLVGIGNTLQGTDAGMAGIVADKFDSLLWIGNYWENANSVGPAVNLGTSSLGSASLSGYVVAANHIDCGSKAASVGIKLDYCKGGVVFGNAFTGVATGISITANATSWFIGPQAWGSNVITKLSIASTDKHGIILDPETRPRFHAVGALQSNVTGDGTSYVVIFATESYDIGSNYDSATGIFTAPYDGVYRFEWMLPLEGLTAGMTVGQADLLHTSSAGATLRDYIGWKGSIAAVRDANNEAGFSGAVVVPMVSGEKAKVRIYITNGTLVADVGASATFSGERL